MPEQYIGVESNDPKFTMIYHRFMDDEGELFQTVYEKMVFFQLRRYANNETSEAFPSVSRLADKCFCSNRTIQRSLKQLEDRGIIRIIRRKTDDNRNQTSVYKLIGLADQPKPEGVTHSPYGDTQSPGGDTQSGGGDTQSPGGDRESHELDSLELDSLNYTHENSDDDDKATDYQMNMFDQFITCMGKQPSGLVAEELFAWVDKDGIEERAINLALEKTALNNAGLNYCRAIINNWLKQGITTLEQAQKQDEEYQKKKQQKQGGSSNHGKPKRLSSETDYNAILRNRGSNVSL